MKPNPVSAAVSRAAAYTPGMKCVLIGDLHHFALRVPPHRLLCRRLLAQTNLWLNRRHQFNHALLPAVVERVASLSPEAVLYSGDLSTSSLESEFEQARRFIDAVAGRLPDGRVEVVVPGNHDRYTFRSRRRRRIDQMLGPKVPAAFPDARTLAPGWTLLSLDAAKPNVVSSRGALGRKQFDAALTVIQNVPAGQGLAVLCHYPCSLPSGRTPHWKHALAEAGPLAEALRACAGRVVYLHGHIHDPWHARPQEGSGPTAGHATGSERLLRSGTAIECVNAGAPCMRNDDYPLGQGFWELDFPDEPRAPLGARHHLPVAPDPTTPPEALWAASDPASISWRTGPDL